MQTIMAARIDAVTGERDSPGRIQREREKRNIGNRSLHPAHFFLGVNIGVLARKKESQYHDAVNDNPGLSSFHFLWHMWWLTDNEKSVVGFGNSVECRGLCIWLAGSEPK